MFFPEDDGNANETYLRVSLFDTDLTMFNNLFQITTNTLGVMQTVTYDNGDAIIRFFDMNGNIVDLDTLEQISLIVF